MSVVNIARCPVHGLHGCREVCFAFEHEARRDCDGRVEQIPYLPWDHMDAAVRRLRELLGSDLTPMSEADFMEVWLRALAATTPDLSGLGAVPDTPPA